MNRIFLIHNNVIKKSFLYESIRPKFISFNNFKDNHPVKHIDEKHKFSSILFRSEKISSLLALKDKSNYRQIRHVVLGGPGYTKFAHGRYKPKLSSYAYFWYTFVFGGLAFILFFDFESFLFRGQEVEEKIKDLKRVYSRTDVPRAKEIENTENEVNSIDENEEEKSISVKKKSKSTFRERKIIQYENKIRHFSTPDKVFRYFSTIKVWNEKLNDYEILMKPTDFIRSMTYGAKQPEGLGLDSYQRYDPNMQKLELNLSEDSVFRHFSKHGLITFSDYIFLVTLLSIPVRHFEIAFHMFDSDGNGNLDIQEFEHLQSIIRSQTSLGQRHRDTHMTGSVIKENSNLNDYFFGKDHSVLLTSKKFTDFQEKLQNEVIKMEFDFCDTKEKNGEKIITELIFCEMILAYAGFSSGKTKKMLKRISKIYDDDENSKGITLKDYEEFFKVLRCIHDIDTALKFYTIAGASIDKIILKHVAKTVAKSDLSDHVIDVIFNLFDEDGDGKLSHKEFIKVMKKRWSRGLETPKDTGFLKFMEAIGTCSKEMIF
ncbi:unnamed protein product [Brachionus calyciflorus]|uniref:EF-hand domain-containing protein n=1 Tax=Brachionus calyciflorus TaxID=104777 RepID=A0A813YW63_9BILA|nr:unnamed protein product [Brachionus calyciflorus]